MSTAAAQAPEFVESFIENAIVAESATERGDTREVWVDLIREGFGNPRDNHYYSRALLEASAPKFVGAKMYANHLSPEAQEALKGYPRAIQDVMGRILETKLAENADGRRTIRGRVNVLQDWLWNMVRRDPGVLGVSINARGSSSEGMSENKVAKIVESISRVNSVDWVTEAGAGGEVVEFVEAQVRAEEENDVTEADTDTTASTEDKDTTAAEDTTSEEDTTATEADDVDVDVEEDDGWTDVTDEDPIAEGEADEDADLKEADDEDDDAIAELDAELWERGETDIGGHDRMPGIPRYGGVRERGDLDHPARRANRGRVDPHELASAFHGFSAGSQFGSLMNAVEAGTIDAEDLFTVIEAAMEMGAEEVDTELSEAIDAAADAAYDRAKEEFDSHITALEAQHEHDLAQIEQRRTAAAMISETDLPKSTKAKLLADFHDFFAEAETEATGDRDKPRDAETVLKDAVEAAIKDKRAELAEFTEAHITGAGDSEGSITEADTERTRSGESASAPAPRGRMLDDDVEAELNPEQRLPDRQQRAQAA